MRIPRWLLSCFSVLIAVFFLLLLVPVLALSEPVLTLAEVAEAQTQAAPAEEAGSVSLQGGSSPIDRAPASAYLAVAAQERGWAPDFEWQFYDFRLTLAGGTCGSDIAITDGDHVWIQWYYKYCSSPERPHAVFEGTFSATVPFNDVVLAVSPLGDGYGYNGGYVRGEGNPWRSFNLCGQQPTEAWQEGDKGYWRFHFANPRSQCDYFAHPEGQKRKNEWHYYHWGTYLASLNGIAVADIPDDQTNAPCDCPVGCTDKTQGWAGGPINTRTGNYHYSQEDISVAALGGPLRFERSYNALETDLYTAPLGYGWTHNYDMDLTFPGDLGGEPDTVIVKGCHGSRFRFADNGDGTYDAHPGVWATLTRTVTAPYTYTLTGVNQSVYTFNNVGQLVEVHNPQGQAITLSYGDGRLARVEDVTGQRFLAFAYDGQGRLAEVRDPLDRTVRYGYDAAGDLAVVTDTRDLVWTYTYTDTHLLRDVRDPDGHVIERTEYDGEGRAVRQWDGTLGDPLQIDYMGSSTTITDPLGRVTVHGYHSYDGVLISQSDAAGSITYTYDANFNWTSSTDAEGNTTEYSFNHMGLAEVITDALDNVTQMAYDDRNHLTEVINALGDTTDYEYDGNLLTTVTDALDGTLVNTYDDQGLLIQTVDHGIPTTYGYDELGQLVAMTDALGYVTTYAYDAVGRLITTTNPAGQVAVDEYDRADNLIRVTENYTAAGDQNYLNAYNLVTAYEYDAVGNLVAVTDTLGHVNCNWYDEANRLIRTTVNYSPTVGPNHDGQWNITTQYAYDTVGNQTRVTDTLGHVTHHWYDDVNRPISSTFNYSPTVGPNHDDQWNITTQYAYDAVGNQTLITDTQSHATQYEYDALNRLIALTDPLGETTCYAYDALSRRTAVTDATEVVVYSTYDSLGRLIETRDALNNGTAYEYDAVGNLVRMTDANGVATRYEYDALGRLLAVVENDEPGQASDHQTNVRTGYVYDAPSTGSGQGLGNRTVITDANGHATHYAYDALGQLVAETDPLGHTTAYAHDALGNTTVMTDADDGVTHYAYDALDRVTRIQYPDSSVQYSYDVLGSRTAMTDSTGTTTYVYDALSRPITVTSPATGTVGYRYDPLGNRTHLIYPGGQVAAYAYDAAGQLTQVEDWDGGLTSYGYDDAGRLVERTLPNGIETRYGYDAAGRLVEMEHSLHSKLLVTYRYILDGVGNRVAATEVLLNPVVYDYFPLAMSENEGQMMGGSGGGDGIEGMLNEGEEEMSPAPLVPQPFFSPLGLSGDEGLSTPGGEPAGGSPATSQVHLRPATAPGASALRASLPDASLLLLAPLAVAAVILQRKKGRWWIWPVMVALLTAAVLGTGGALVQAGEQRAVAQTGSQVSSMVRTIVYTYDPLGRLTRADYSTGESFAYRYDAVGNRVWEETEAVGEVGQVEALTDAPQMVVLDREYAAPVVFAQPASRYGGDTAVVRVTDVQADRFTLYVDEAPNENGTHTAESVSYVVLEAGTWELSDGTWLEVGTLDTSATVGKRVSNVWGHVTFSGAFSTIPVVISQVQTENDVHWVKTRQQDVTATGFDVALEEEEAKTTPHGSETIGWLAIEAGQGDWSGHAYEAGQTANAVTQDWYQITFGQTFAQAPRFVAALATYDGADNAHLRYDHASLTTSGVKVLAEEDTTYDSETDHTTEVVHYLALQGDGVLVAGRTYEYDAANRLTSLDGVTYTWDDRGNQTSNGTFTYTYDGGGRLVQAESLTATLVYTYSGDGLRVARGNGAQTTTYVWDVAAGMPQVLSDGERLYLPGVGQWDGENWTYELTDGLGSVRQLADSDGNLVQRYDYGPFGRVLAAEGLRGSMLQYTGEAWDADAGLLYLRARWYDPATGRFLTRDPFPGLVGFPQTQHPYVYCMNNPVNFVDPSGEIVPVVVIAILAGAAIGAVGGGLAYAMTHPCEDYWHSKEFWQAVGVGAAAGAVAGLVGWAIPALLPAAGSFWGAVGIGVLSGSVAAGAGQLTTNLLLGNPWHQGVVRAMVVGGITGGIAGGVGYGAKQLLRTAAKGMLQRLTTQANDELAQNPTLAKTVLTDIDYAAGTANRSAANLRYGRALEFLVRDKIRYSLYRAFFRHVGGANNPDFVGRGLFTGLRFDVTTGTARSYSEHLGRWYGPGLIFATYTRPTSFTVFPP